MEEGAEENSAIYRKFLKDFCKKYDESDASEDNRPFKINSRFITEEELEGECLDWVLQTLFAK